MNQTLIDTGLPRDNAAVRAPASLMDHVLRSIAGRRMGTDPYRHWFLADVLPIHVADVIDGLPFAPASIEDTEGKRETHNALRVFCSPETRRRFAVCEDLAAAFQASSMVRALDDAFGTTLGGSYLRIEYCQDTSGFWLEPHRDVSVKLLTMQVYLSRGADAHTLGTDIYLDAERWFATAPSPFNAGFVFVPGDNTWHGFRARSFEGVRKSLIINYVTPDWRARHELAYPQAPVS